MAIIPEKLPDSVDKAVENLTDTPTAVLGKGFAAIFSLVFDPIIHLDDKRKARYLHNLNIYKQELDNSLAAIPKENLIEEPKLQIAAQALEDSKYCIEEPVLREMFAKLIASASDRTKADTVHPSFSTIIKQMSPQDATTLQRIKLCADKYGPFLPIAKFNFAKSGMEGTVAFTYDIIIPDSSDVSKIISFKSLSTLLALGLIDIDYSHSLTAKDAYEHFEQYADASGYRAQVKQAGGKLKLKKGICELTPYGQNFVNACGL